MALKKIGILAALAVVCGSAAALGADPATPVPVFGLDRFANLAELGTAIALAYAAVKNFRYRAYVQGYVRKLIYKDDGAFITFLKTHPNFKNTSCWAILYRLGNLKENSEPPPDDGVEPDRHFLETKAYIWYNWLYSSNLDKTIIISLGAISASTIWFGVLDAIYSPEPVSGDEVRNSFLDGITVCYASITILGLCVIYLHRRLWCGEADKSAWQWRTKALWAVDGVAAFFFLFEILAATFNFNFSIPVLAPYMTANAVGISAITLSVLILATIILPVVLVLKARHILDNLRREIDRCYDDLKKQFPEPIKDVEIKPPPDQRH